MYRKSVSVHIENECPKKSYYMTVSELRGGIRTSWSSCLFFGGWAEGGDDIFAVAAQGDRGGKDKLVCEF